MKKILFIATVPNFLTGFLINNFKILHELNWEIHIATNCEVPSKREFLDFLIVHNISIQRSPLNIDNYKAYKQIINIVTDNSIDVIDCHTPVGGALGRLVAHRLNLKCLYTSHGFHFYKKGPLLNWIIYYPIEKYLSKYTDVLITINSEDFKIAKEKFKMKRVEYIPGVGVDTDKFILNDFNKDQYRKKLGLSKEDFAILSVGELNKNKNHEVIIRAISKINNPNIHYLIAGEGEYKNYLLQLAEKLNLSDNIHILGFRKDIVELNNSVDLFAFPSKREGLGLAAIEAMAAGIPIITSNTRGINDYSQNGQTGYKFKYNDIDGFAKGIKSLFLNKSLRLQMSHNCVNVSKSFDKNNTYLILKRIYYLYI